MSELTCQNMNDDEFPEYFIVKDVLDLHGFYPEQVEEIVTEFIDNAIKQKLFHLRIIHGKGKSKMKWSVYKCLENNYNVKVLVSMLPENKESFMFHTPNIHLTKLQAEALEIPFYSAIVKGEKEKEVKELFNHIKKVKEEYNIECLGVGAFASEYQYNRVAKIAEELDLKVFTPLWKKEPKKMVQEMIDSGFEIILSAIAANGFTKEPLSEFR